MGKAWQPFGYERLVGGSETSSHAADGAAFRQPIEPSLQPVESDLQFNPSASLGSVRRWLHIDDRGSARLVEVDKHALIQDLRIRYRDLIALDPSTPIPHPSSLLIREKALVCNLESIRLIICANQCYVLSVPKEGDPRTAAVPQPDHPFVVRLCRVLGAGASNGSSPITAPSSAEGLDISMPYELRGLDCALGAAVQLLGSQVAQLEAAGYPAVERLAGGVSRTSLESVRGCKAALTRLQGRVLRLRQELEKIMDDDADMQDMYLGRRAALCKEPLPLQPPVTLAGPTRRARTHGSLAGLGGEVPPHAPQAPAPPCPPRAGGHSKQAPAQQAPALAAEGAAVQVGPAQAPAEAAAAGAADPLDSQAGGAAADAVGKPGQGGSRGRAAAQLWGQGRALAQRAGLVLRTVRRTKTRGPRQSALGDSAGGGAGGLVEEEEEEEVIEREVPFGGMGALLVVDPHDIEEAEDLLEAYFMQADYLLRRMLVLGERTAATEALLSIEMDHRRNELVAVDLLVTCVVGAFTFVATVAGIFGMNIALGGWSQVQGSFAMVVGLSCAGGATLLIAILLYIRRKRLMFISSLA